MQNRKIRYITSASVAAALSFGTIAFAQSSNRGTGEAGSDQSASSTPSATQYTGSQHTSENSDLFRSGSMDQGSTMGRLRVATKKDTQCQASAYDDAKVRGTDGKELGQVRDFLIDPQAGQVRFAVVSSGGWAGIGDTLHVVPFTALKAANRGANDDDKQDFTVAVSQSQWKNAPTIKEDSFEEGRVTLDPQIEQQVAQTFQSSSSSGNQNANGALLRASKIRGRDVMANGQDIGSIEGVVLQPGHSDAMALIDPDDDFAGGEQKYVVPLTKLQIANVGNGSVNTQLTRNDFRAVTNSSAGATASSTASTAVTGSTMGTTSDAAISPTGSTSGFSSDTTSTDTLSTGSSSGTTTLSTDSTQASSTTGNSTTSTGTPQP